ncbi:HAD-superfamily subfamily IB hydrolase, TIGR01490 [Corynebacterium camporealensis]|uniref:HAD-superfamily subfamily IB hydrolase, TIGR01490 n=2 Tax=Corynebacterium camporealensis TaxID=161896 RepID=A0A0F6TA47_9CORY|nr:HAD-superfamily subfamily IB hydrolase, TIGR01490 [Corynebacterium camporealensis]AVH87556.1 HAD-superfamily subfamily IB hydrolase, TIGR01490 [Corynebacterium camporealensis]
MDTIVATSMEAVDVSDLVPGFPESPREFLANWTASRGNLRNFLENQALAPLDAESQREAGAAAAEAALSEFGIDLDAFNSGVDSVSGSYTAAGAQRITNPDPDVPQDPGAAAFFDVDNTLIQGSSLVEFAFGLARRRYFRISEIAPIAWKQLKFRLSGKENAADVAAGRTQALEFIKGRSEAELIELCEEIVDEKMSRKAYSGTTQLAEMHLAAGQQVWLVTATPVQLAQVLARRFGFTGALGTVAEVEDGKFTGRLLGDILHGPGKMHAVAALATIEGLDLQRCTAYSDSANDVPMLSMVGTAVAINPDGKLRRIAQRRGWLIRDYRSIRKAVRTYGLPALATAAFSYGGWRLRRPKNRPATPPQ